MKHVFYAALAATLIAAAAGCSRSGTDAPTTEGPKVYTEQEFDQLVRQADHPVLVDFTASWCPPCKRMKPILAELEAEREGALSVVAIDVDANPDLAQQFQVQYLPTFILYKDGEALDLRYGMIPKDQLTAWIDGLLAGASEG